MKLFQKFQCIIAVITTFAVAGCATDPLSIIESEAIENPDYEIIRSLGLSTEDIIETEDSYIVEGDIVFSKSSLQGYSGKTRQKRYSSLVSPSKVGDIKVYIYPELHTNNGGGATWYQAVLGAIEEWNDIPNCIIRFTPVASETQADVVVRRNPAVNTKPSTVAWGNIPYNGNPGEYVEIGLLHEFITAAQKKYVMVHEFGHVLGYAHMDESYTQIPGTPISEPESVMATTSVGGRSWNDNGTRTETDSHQAISRLRKPRMELFGLPR